MVGTVVGGADSAYTASLGEGAKAMAEAQERSRTARRPLRASGAKHRSSGPCCGPATLGAAKRPVSRKLHAVTGLVPKFACVPQQTGSAPGYCAARRRPLDRRL